MRRKVELVGGYFDGMKTFVDLDAQEVNLIAPDNKPVEFNSDLYPPTESITKVVKYRRRLGSTTIFDWVKDEG